MLIALTKLKKIILSISCGILAATAIILIGRGGHNLKNGKTFWTGHPKAAKSQETTNTVDRETHMSPQRVYQNEKSRANHTIDFFNSSYLKQNIDLVEKDMDNMNSILYDIYPDIKNYSDKIKAVEKELKKAKKDLNKAKEQNTISSLKSNISLAKGKLSTLNDIQNQMNKLQSTKNLLEEFKKLCDNKYELKKEPLKKLKSKRKGGIKQRTSISKVPHDNTISIK